jgi:omega-6 fatty acid desaturase (delta-12 desaturase)
MPSTWELTEDTPLYSALHLLGQQLIGWPYHLLANESGSENYQNRRDGRGKGKHNGFGGGVNQFQPSSPLFSSEDEPLIVLSDLGIGLVLAVVAFLSCRFGWLNMLVWYWIPYMWVNHWLGQCHFPLLSSEYV